MNETKAEGFLDEAKGKVKQAWGDVTGNNATKAEGTADVVKGNAEQGWGNVKDAAHDASYTATHNHGTDPVTGETTTTSHSFSDDMKSGVQHVKESVQHGLDNMKRKSDD